MLEQLYDRFSSDLAIDLGTTTTLVGVAGAGLQLDEPSIVAVREGTRQILSGGCAVGHLAKQMSGRTPDSIRVVRPLSEGVIRDFELCEAMLRYFLKKVQQSRFRIRPRAIVAIPGCITPVEKRALYNSALRAGARQIYLLSEAKAAALGSGLPIAEPVASMVCDIGGGTTDVAVMSLSDIVASASVRIGGDQMDKAIVAYIKRHFSLRMGMAAAEQLRIEIGSAAPLAEELVSEVRGVDVVSGLPRRATITSEEVRHALADPLAEVIEAIKTTIDGCPPDLAADLIDTGMILAGGGALLRELDRYITDQTGIPARLADDPRSTVARGVLICLEDLPSWRNTLESSDDDV